MTNTAVAVAKYLWRLISSYYKEHKTKQVKIMAYFHFKGGTVMLNSFLDAKVLTTLGSTLGLVLLDLLLGIILSIKQGNFDVRKLPQFLTSGVLPYVGSLLVFVLFAGSLPAIYSYFLYFCCDCCCKVFG